MSPALNAWIPLIARVSLGMLFLIAGWNKITGLEGTVSQIASVGLPVPGLLALCAIVIEIGCSIALILGYYARYAALVLGAFVVLATLMFHTDLANPLQQIMALKNLSIIGGLLMVYMYGPGPKSLCCECDCENCKVTA
jgi:putative oxidoreductase